MAIKASNQIDLIDLTDGYTVYLTNESHTFAGTTTSVNGTQTTTFNVHALCGNEVVPCELGTISTPTGISAVSDNKKPSPKVTVTATSALTTSGSFEVPVLIGDITINKVFSYSIAFKGTTGAQGVSITGVTNSYLASASSSGVTTATSGWTETVQKVDATKKYLWNYETVTYSSGNPTTTTPVIIGMYSQPGAAGSPGKGITGIVEYYQVGTSNTVEPTGTWETTPPVTDTTKKYLWNYEVISYTTGEPTTTAKKVIGTHGATGTAGSDAILMVITSSGGSIFKNTAIATTLTAKVYKGGLEVTGATLTALGTIKWYKDSGTTAIAKGTNFTVAAGDVTDRATFTAQLEG